MAETAQIKSSPQSWCARGLVISGLTGQKKLKFYWWVVIDVEYTNAKGFLNFFMIWSSYLLFKIGSN